MITRRTLLLGGMTALICADLGHAQNPIDSLIRNQYNGNIRLKQTGFWVDNAFRLAQAPNQFRLEVAHFTAHQGGAKHEYSGYWIWRTDINECWQELGDRRLHWWNEDRRANPPVPENYEIFTFRLSEANNGTVKLRNEYFGTYVGMSGDALTCNEPSTATAAEFVPEFV